MVNNQSENWSEGYFEWNPSDKDGVGWNENYHSTWQFVRKLTNKLRLTYRNVATNWTQIVRQQQKEQIQIILKEGYFEKWSRWVLVGLRNGQYLANYYKVYQRILIDISQRHYKLNPNCKTASERTAPKISKKKPKSENKSRTNNQKKLPERAFRQCHYKGCDGRFELEMCPRGKEGRTLQFGEYLIFIFMPCGFHIVETISSQLAQINWTPSLHASGDAWTSLQPVIQVAEWNISSGWKGKWVGFKIENKKRQVSGRIELKTGCKCKKHLDGKLQHNQPLKQDNLNTWNYFTRAIIENDTVIQWQQHQLDNWVIGSC